MPGEGTWPLEAIPSLSVSWQLHQLCDCDKSFLLYGKQEINLLSQYLGIQRLIHQTQMIMCLVVVAVLVMVAVVVVVVVVVVIVVFKSRQTRPMLPRVLHLIEMRGR